MKVLLSLIMICVAVGLSGCNFLATEDDLNGNNKKTDKTVKAVDVKKKAEEKGIKYEENKKSPSSVAGSKNTKEDTMEIKKKNLEYANKYKSAIVKTNLGDVEVEFFNDDAPQTVGNFIRLAEEGFYDGVKFHRVIADFMIQSGDPNSKDDDWSNDGLGGPGYKFEDEINDHKLVKSSLAMANSGPNTNGSQFFIVTAENTPWLDGKHTNFGKVVGGMEVVDRIEETETGVNDHPIEDIVIEKITFVE